MRLTAILIAIALIEPLINVTHSESRIQYPDNWTTIRVDCPETSSARSIQFEAKVSQGVPVVKLHFKWRVFGGKIISGQGTEEIIVKSKRHQGQRVQAVVTVIGLRRTIPTQHSVGQ